MAFPKQGRTNEGTKENHTGFPLKPVPDICYRGTGGNDRVFFFCPLIRGVTRLGKNLWMPD